MIRMAKPPSPKKTKPGYQIPQKAFDVAIDVPVEIADDYGLDPKVRLTAVKEIRATIDHDYDIQQFHEHREAHQQTDKPVQVIVIEDEHFFGNNAHAQVENSTQDSPQPKPTEPRDPPS